MAQTMKDILYRMLNHEELSREEMKQILVGITKSEYPTEQITALLTALQILDAERYHRQELRRVHQAP